MSRFQLKQMKILIKQLISEMIKCFEEKKEKNKKKINDEGLNKKRKRNTNCILI